MILRSHTRGDLLDVQLTSVTPLAGKPFEEPPSPLGPAPYLKPTSGICHQALHGTRA
jgi:hypothetical protein